MDKLFKCPECGGSSFFREIHGVTAKEYSYGTTEQGYIDYGDLDCEFDDATTAGFYCEKCNWQIPAYEEDEMIEWLEKHGEDVEE